MRTVKTAFVVTYFENWQAAVPINTVPLNDCLQRAVGYMLFAVPEFKIEIPINQVLRAPTTSGACAQAEASFSCGMQLMRVPGFDNCLPV